MYQQQQDLFQQKFNQMAPPQMGPQQMNGNFTQMSQFGGMQEMPQYMDQQDDFYENLVGKISTFELARISGDLKRGVDTDLQSRSEWEQKLANGIKQLGLAPDTNTQDYSMSANLFSSAFMQTGLTSVAQYCSVLLPPGGPAHMKMMNNVKDKQLLDILTTKASDISSFINNLLTDLSPDFYPESEQAFFWTWLYGNCFKKCYFDEARALPVSPLIKPQDLILNNNAINLLSAPRITHRFYITHRELKLNQMSGRYADVPIKAYKNYDDSPIDDILNRISGIDKGTSDSDETSLYQMCETRTDQIIPYLQPNPKILCPYLIEFERETGTIVSFKRNWLKHDPYAKRINDIIHYSLFPGPGIYSLGAVHIMGSNAEAATELLRQLLFSGKMANFPAFIRSKGMRMDNSTIRLQPGESAEIDTGNKSVQDCLMKVPFSGPDPLFKQMKDDLEQSIIGSSNSLNTAISDMNPNAPVGTTLALIEQASKVETSIIKRLHKSMGEELNLIYKLISQNFDKMSNAFASEGKTFPVTKQDFLIDFKLLPVADPNLATSTHLLIQSEALSQVYTQFPNLINPRSIVELKLKALKINDVDSFLLPEQKDVEPRPAIVENMDIINGKPVRAGIEQNHPAEIQTHSGLFNNPAVANDPALQATLTAHIHEHVAFEYQLKMQELMGGQQIPQDGQPQDMQQQNQIAEQAAQATQQLVHQYQEALQAGQPKEADPTAILMADIKAKEDAMTQKAHNDFLTNEREKYKIDMDYELKLREMDDKYRAQESQLEHERNLAEQQVWTDRINQEHEGIKSQISQIMSHFDNLSAQEMQQEHEKQQQAEQQQHEQMQQQQEHAQQQSMGQQNQGQ